MPRIYTRTGDDGMTSLGSGRRVSKDSLRVAAYGDIDELNSIIGLALSLGVVDDVENLLTHIQNDLFVIGAALAFPDMEESAGTGSQVGSEQIDRLENEIDHMSSAVGPLKNFILPGGTPSAAALHTARSVCRRAERSIVQLSGQETVDRAIIVYINRLSDALFAMARFENFKNGSQETVWKSEVG